MVQFLSIIFFLGFLQFLLGFSKVTVFLCHLYNASTPAPSCTASHLKGAGGSYPPKKWPICKADHSSLLSAEVMNAWTDTSPPNIRLHDVAGYLTNTEKVLPSL